MKDDREPVIPDSARTVPVRISQRVRAQLRQVQGMLMQQRGRQVTAAEAIEYLIECERKARTP